MTENEKERLLDCLYNISCAISRCWNMVPRQDMVDINNSIQILKETLNENNN